MNDLLGDSSREFSAAGGGTTAGSVEMSTNGKKKKRDVEAGREENEAEGDPGMDEFFREEAAIQGDLSQITSLLKKLEEAHQESQTLTNAKALKALKERMARDLDDVSKVVRHIKGKIEALDRSNLASRKKPNCGEGTSTDRTRMGLTAGLKVKLKDLMTQFVNLRQSFNDEYRQVVERRVFTVTGQKADEEMIDQLIETGNSEQIFQKAIQAQGRGQILDTIAEIQERHDSVKDIEKKLLELHQIFLDMAVLVEAQGELLDNISKNVSTAQDYVARGGVALGQARKLQKGTRKCMCYAVILLLIIILIIVLATVKPWQK
ncbi:syntaxin 1B/2/3 [Marchantia polymorpha subsp. ruderalis]|nr:hypothetical protein MARPO_0055s0091 [Marchantia polymorpha]BAS01258.1 syntaxin of plant 13B [Marchantia polymorpha]BBN02956.1 hypothetical protein Mp_2g19600 [Marchantia polymorpha subsp. ruderalis]|eukprot:PTQ37834.1 hypothetical protein MARPO_0055s0091 [Marchantia polymorpha]